MEILILFIPGSMSIRLNFLATIICYFGLFRINEILRIRPCDIQISDCPFSLAVVRITSIATVIPVY